MAERITNVKKERIEDDRRPPVGIRGLVAAPRLCGTIYKHYDFKTLVLVASARHPQHVVEAGLTDGHYLYDALFDFPAGQTPADGSGCEKISRGLKCSTHK